MTKVIGVGAIKKQLGRGPKKEIGTRGARRQQRRGLGADNPHVGL